LRAEIAEGRSYELLMKIGTGVFESAFSVPVFLEYESVAMRELSKLPVSEEEMRKFLNFIIDASDKFRIPFLWRPLLRDEEG